MKKISIILAIAAVAASVASCTKEACEGFYDMNGAIYANEEGQEQPQPGDSFNEIKENDFTATATQPVSTFSMDANGRFEASASENMLFASGVAALGLCLRESKYAGDASIEMAKELVDSGRSFDPGAFRKQLSELIGTILKR